MLVRARSRDVLLPILLYPMTVPVMIAGVRGTAAAAPGRTRRGDGPRRGLALLRFFDVVFVTLSLWTFEPLMTELRRGQREVSDVLRAKRSPGHCRRRRCSSRWRPSLIAQAPYESTMGLVQKIFYFHVPAAW